MASMQFAISFNQWITVTPTTERSGHPATNVGIIQKWRRTWQSNDTTATTLVFDFGASPPPLNGMFINNANFLGLVIEGSPNSTTWTSIASTTTFNDERVGRRKRWVPFTATYRYIRVTPSTAFAGYAYFEIGTIAFPVVQNFSDCFGFPWQWTPRQAATRSDFPGGGADVNIEGPYRLEYQLVGGPWLTANINQMLSIHQLGTTAPIWLYENRGPGTGVFSAYAYILRRMEDVPFSERINNYDAPWHFEEAM